MNRLHHGLFFGLVLALAAPGAARAGSSSSPSPGPKAAGTDGDAGFGDSDDGDDDDSDDSDDDDHDGGKPRITLGGRVFVRDTVQKRHVDGAQLTNVFGFESVRGNIDLHAYNWLRTSIEVTFGQNGKIDLNDVYVSAHHLGFSLVAGRFKRPISPIAMTSIYDLPILERGILDQTVTVPGYSVPLDLSDRSEGVMAEYRSKQGIRPHAYLGLFNATLPRADAGGAEPADVADNLLRDVYGRASIEPIDGFEVGGTLGLVTRARFVSELQSVLIGELDLTVETRNFRAWLEGYAGKSTLFDGVAANGSMVAMRLLVAPRFNHPIPQLRRVEPYVIVSVLDPTDKTDDNRAVEPGGGINVQVKKALHLTLEYVYDHYGDNYPTESFAFVNTSTVRFQISSQFR